ncbi:hypothetical protein Y032_0548g3282 [Ancylostoma ceylanicum]|uniref:Uncharacterized protein n=1 Tax=Ancylostoma ceylanicum TaxID=53326 RepID=A0A016WQR0_9BILA|nr:hypothetical protein Y032_0548g3282 [Ancylostoma ceylanicum]
MRKGWCSLSVCSHYRSVDSSFVSIACIVVKRPCHGEEDSMNQSCHANTSSTSDQGSFPSFVAIMSSHRG